MNVDIFGEFVEEIVDEEYKADKGAAFFDILNDINVNKQWIVSRETMKGYSPFSVSRAMSQHPDTALLANELNKYNVSDSKMHYDYLMLTVPPKKRFGKWAKAEAKDEDTIKNVALYFEVSFRQAEQYIAILDKQEIDKINKNFEQGGKNG